MKRTWRIDSAPGKELLGAIANGSKDAFKEFYEVRKRWSGGYPFIHDGLVTYGFTDDLTLASEAKIELLSTVVEIALEEEPMYFHSALSLLANFIPDDRILARPEGFGGQLLLLKRKAEQYGFVANMTCTWETLVTKARCLKPTCHDPSYVPTSELLIEADAFLEYYPMPFPRLGSDEENACPIDQKSRLEEGNKTCHAGVDCKFECSAIIDGSKWWIFRCYPNAPNFIRIGYVYVRLSKDQRVTLGHWTAHRDPISEEGMHRKLLKLEYSLIDAIS